MNAPPDTVVALTVYTTHACIPLMRAAGRGAIVNVGSTGSLQGYGLLSGYTASKHGVVGLTKSTALENADIPIRANCICPGPVDTQLMRDIELLVNPDDPAAARAMFSGTTRSSATASSRRSPTSFSICSVMPPPTSRAPRCRSTAG